MSKNGPRSTIRSIVPKEQPLPEEQKFVSISQAAKILGVTRPTIYSRLNSGQLKAVRFGSGAIRIPISELEAQPLKYLPSPRTVHDIRDTKAKMMTRDEAVAKYNITNSWFYKKILEKGIKAMRFGKEAYYPKDALRDLFYKPTYPGVEEWITSEELAQKTGHTRKYICDLAREFNIPRIRNGKALLISKKDWDKYVIDERDLQKHYLNVDQAKKHYHIGQERFYEGVNEAGLEGRRQGRMVFFLKKDLDRLFKDKSPKIPAEIRRDFITAKEALSWCHVGQKRFSADTKAAGVTKIRTAGNYVWYNKEELRKLFKL